MKKKAKKRKKLSVRRLRESAALALDMTHMLRSMGPKTEIVRERLAKTLDLGGKPKIGDIAFLMMKAKGES